MGASISASVGLSFLAVSAAAAMIIPGWQNPHCGTLSATQACWTGCERSRDSDSIVVTKLASAAALVLVQLRPAPPSMRTVHAPQSPVPPPHLVPVSLEAARSAQGRGEPGSARSGKNG